MEDIIYSLLKQGLTVLLTGIATYFWQKYKSGKAEETALRDAVCCLLRDRLVQAHHYHVQKGSISVASMDNIQRMKKAYEDLGGNGTTKQIMEEIENLPIES